MCPFTLFQLSDDYHEYIDILEELYIEYSLRGTVALIGGMNVTLAGYKYVFLNDKRSDVFKTFTNKHNLISVTVQLCKRASPYTRILFRQLTSSATKTFNFVLIRLWIAEEAKDIFRANLNKAYLDRKRKYIPL